MSNKQLPRMGQSSDGSWYQVTSDGMRNVVSGLGTIADKRTHNQFTHGASFHNLVQLEAAYVGNWIARQIVQVPVDDALREWRSVQHADAEAIHAEEKRLKVSSHLRDGAYWSRLYGGAATLMITDQPLDQPLRVERLQKGSLKRLVTLDRWDIQPQSINYTDVLAEDFLMPEYYNITHGTQAIHSSHFIRYDGEPLPRRMRQLNETWGDSILRKIMEDLADVTATKGGIAALIQEANVDVISRDGLTEELSTNQHNAILERYAINKQMAGLVNQMLLDKDTEELQRHQISFGGLGEILDKLMIWTSGAADIPMTRLFGQSAAGMNATGEGDQDNYFNKVSSEQEAKYRPALERLDEVMVRSALGEYPDDYVWEWNPLYQESGNELAQQDLARSQSESVRLQDRILRRSHVLARIKEEGRYAVTDDEIEAMRKIEAAEDKMLAEDLAAGEDPSDPDANPEEEETSGEGEE